MYEGMLKSNSSYYSCPKQVKIFKLGEKRKEKHSPHVNSSQHRVRCFLMTPDVSALRQSRWQRAAWRPCWSSVWLSSLCWQRMCLLSMFISERVARPQECTNDWRNRSPWFHCHAEPVVQLWLGSIRFSSLSPNLRNTVENVKDSLTSMGSQKY